MPPLVLVHGNPEIDAIWDPLVAALDREAIRLSPPGFGAPLPAGFGPAPEAYRAWVPARGCGPSWSGRRSPTARVWGAVWRRSASRSISSGTTGVAGRRQRGD